MTAESLEKNLVIAIDGPAGAGKGTLARALARALGFAYLDTGLLYRALAARVLANLGQIKRAAGRRIEEELSDFALEHLAHAALPDFSLADLESPDLRGERCGQLASRIATRSQVREDLLPFQREFAAAPPGGEKGAVLDGRDVGTVVCPEAKVKIFVTASPEIRAGRRHKELIERGEHSIYARVLEEMTERDRRGRLRRQRMQ
jgi:cytidylate kinase